ncbi:MAG: hypothetical protein JEZ06_02680 [Anaerolineaceae bacterium]|nr:hypothetical protein [Anaerolineaceae bacterium]
MTRDNLDGKINVLLDKVMILESMVRKAVLDSVKALHERNFDLSQGI